MKVVSVRRWRGVWITVIGADRGDIERLTQLGFEYKKGKMRKRVNTTTEAYWVAHQLHSNGFWVTKRLAKQLRKNIYEVDKTRVVPE